VSKDSFFTRSIALAVTGVAMLAGCALAPASAWAKVPVVPPVNPESDTFYTPPANFARKAPGVILRARKVPLGKTKSTLTTIVGDASAAYELLYRTNDSTGQPTATVATLLVPAHPAPGPRRLVSYQVAEDSETLQCAPSYTLRLEEAHGAGTYEDKYISDELAHGWDVVVSDYEGPQSELIVGPIEGQATLDGIRAAENFNPANTGLEGSKTEVGMTGYSGGSVPTVWADALAPTYARELNVVGVAAGGIDADMPYVVANIEGSPYFGGLIDALVSVDRAYPELNPLPLLNEEGLKFAQSDGTDALGCGGGVGSDPFGTASEVTNYASTQELEELPQVNAVMEKLNLDAPGAPVPTAPGFFYNSREDEVFRFQQVESMVAKFCSAGDSVDFDPSTGSHLEGLFKYFTPALEFLEGRFAGQPAPNTCS
jgi:hypothetical protein